MDRIGVSVGGEIVMIIWINGAFGSGKTTTAYELHRRVPNSFVYDPENIGYFIRKQAPRAMLKPDFQDHPMWREMNYSMLREISNEFDGIMIVPMTIVNPQYFHEIIDRLRMDGVTVHHFALLASRETLLKRLKSRGDHAQSWPAQQIDRCVSSLSEDMFRMHLHTDDLTPEQVIEQIAGECGIEIQPDPRGRFRRKLDRFITKIRHIRF